MKTVSIKDIPFNRLIRLEKSDRKEYIFQIAEHPEIMNHVNSLHAGVIFSLAESASGQYLQSHFGDINLNIYPVIRRAEVKYSKPCNDVVYANASLVRPAREDLIAALETNGRVLVTVRSEVYDRNDEKLMTALFDWFIALRADE